MNKTDIVNKVDAIFTEKFVQYDIDKTPDLENNPDSRLTHGSTGFLGEFTFLYVDMRGSSSFTDEHRLQTITKIYKVFHHSMVECIKENNGKVRSFDGDRVLAVFEGKRKINNAIECAMQMIGIKYDILQPKIKTYYNNDSFSFGVGIATGNVMISKAGVGYDKNNRDLIWIGDPANLGAKLSDQADSPYSIHICKKTFGRLLDNNRYTLKEGRKIDMWTKDTFQFKDEDIDIFKTGYYRSI